MPAKQEELQSSMDGIREAEQQSSRAKKQGRQSRQQHNMAAGQQS